MPNEGNKTQGAPYLKKYLSLVKWVSSMTDAPYNKFMSAAMASAKARLLPDGMSYANV